MMRVMLLFVVLLAWVPPHAIAWTFTKTFEEFTVGQTGGDSNFSPSTGGSVTNTYAHGGTKSFQVSMLFANGESVGVHIMNFPSNVTEGQELWWRIYVFAPTGFNWTTGSLAKLMRLTNKAPGGADDQYLSILWERPQQNECNTATYGSPPNVYGYLVVEGGEWYQDVIAPQGYPTTSLSYCQNRNTSNNGSKFLVTNAWQSVEMYVKVSSSGTGAYRMWYDGVLFWEQANISTIDSGGYLGNGNTVTHLLGAWNGGVPVDQIIYFDDIVMTTDTPSGRDILGNPMIGLTQYKNARASGGTALSGGARF